MNIKRLTSVLTLSLLLTACSGQNKTNNNMKANNNTSNQNKVEESTNDNTANKADNQTENDLSFLYLNSSTKLSAEEATNVLLEKYPNAKIKDISYESEDFVYEVTGVDGKDKYEVYVNPSTAEVIKEEKDTENENDFLNKDQIAKVETLIQKAIDDANGDYKVKEYELDIDDEICKLDLEIQNSDGSKLEYTFNVDNGEIIEKE